MVGVIHKKHSIKYQCKKINSRNYSKYNRDEFKSDLRKIPWEKCFQQTDFNTAWNLFKSYVINTVNKHAPVIEKNVRGKECPWMSRVIKQKMNTRDYLLRKAKRSKSEEDWLQYKRMRNVVTNSIPLQKQII